VSNVRPSGRNRSRNDVTNIRPRSRTFRSVANYWDATNAVLKAYGRYSKLVSSCQSSNHTRSSRLLCFSGHCKAPIPFWKGIRTLLVFATICDRSSHCMMRWIGSPHHVKNVHAMRLSCGGATRRLIATNCEKGLLSFSLLFGEGVAPRPGPLGMEMPPKISSHPGRTDGNSQPFRELRSITRQHRGCGGDWVC
jgi:hypothetical protein